MFAYPRSRLQMAVTVSIAAGLLVACSTTAPATLSTSSGSPSATDQPTDLPATQPTTSKVGELAPDFPVDILPVPPDAEVLVSSAAPTPSGLWEVSLNVRTTQDANGLLEAVRGPLIAAGFTEQPVTPAAGLVVQTTFSRADGELIMVGIRDDSDTRTLTAGGTISRAAG